MTQLALHPAWPRLTDDQRQAVNEVWDDVVIPALGGAQSAVCERDRARLEAQDARAEARYWRERYDRLRWEARPGA